jgi:hypothetical protein
VTNKWLRIIKTLKQNLPCSHCYLKKKNNDYQTSASTMQTQITATLLWCDKKVYCYFLCTKNNHNNIHNATKFAMQPFLPEKEV